MYFRFLERNCNNCYSRCKRLPLFDDGAAILLDEDNIFFAGAVLLAGVVPVGEVQLVKKKNGGSKTSDSQKELLLLPSQTLFPQVIYATK